MGNELGEPLRDDLSAYSEPLRMELLAASLRADTADINVFVETLANKLANSLPTQTSVVRHSGLFSREHPVKEISVALGEHVYRLVKERRGPLQTYRSRVVRGIVLKTDELPLEQWIEELAQGLAQSAAQSAQTRAALERFLL